MPQLVILALLGAGAYAGYRLLARAARELAAEKQRAQEELRQRAAARPKRDLGWLEYDAESGVYRPAKRG